MTIFNKHFRTVVAGAVLALGTVTVSSAIAAPVFQVDPNSLSGVAGYAPFSADFVNGVSSARVTNTGGFNYDSNGYISFGQFSLNGNPIQSLASGLGSAYGLYATFSQTFTCGSLLSPGVTCAVSSISLNLYADIWDGNLANINTFTGATVASDPTVTDNGGNDVMLGSANFVYAGLAGINDLGGAFENVTTNFLLTALGESFFIDPVPFYTLAFSNFNNTSQGIVCDTGPTCVDATIVAINSENGGTDFNGVPEPATLALMGIGLIGIGSIRRRKV
jgi:hypothetical protein